MKSEPTAEAAALPDRLASGTRVRQIGVAPRYYKIELTEGRVGWSYKGNFTVVSTETPATPGALTAEDLLRRQDVLKIIVLDVEVGDATLITCPEEDGKQDVILIDTGENDSNRIREELTHNGFGLAGRPITRFIITHYDFDHFGDAAEIVPVAEVVYDHGDNIKQKYRAKYLGLVGQPGVDRRLMTLDYLETFTGGVTIECVAVNQATDFDPNDAPSSPDEDNPNSIALIVSFAGFDYFTAGDLTHQPERSLAKGIRNCDAYHVDHHGSRATSSDLDFLRRLDPEVSIASNGTQHGHPTSVVAQRLINEIGSSFFQTNANPDSRAHRPDPKFVADDTDHEDNEAEDAEGAQGTIRVIVEPASHQYFVLMPGLPLADGTFPIEP